MSQLLNVYLAMSVQFHEAGCDNCPFFQMEGDKERVADCTTPNFQSLITVMEPNSSWAAKWLHVSENPPHPPLPPIPHPLI